MDAGDLVPDDVMIGIVDERLDQRRHHAAGATCSTASRARCRRPRRSTRSSPSGRSTWSSTSRCRDDVVLERLAARRVCIDCGTNYSVDGAAEARLDLRRLRRRGRPARRRHRGGDQPPPRPLRARDRAADRRTTRSRACWSMVDGVGTADEVLGPARRRDRRRPASAGRRAVTEPSPVRTRRPARRRCAGPAGSWPRCTTRIRAAIRPGVTTAELDRIGREVLDRRGATLELPRLPRLSRR